MIHKKTICLMFNNDAEAAADGDEAWRAFEAMMTVGKIDVAAIDVARRG